MQSNKFKYTVEDFKKLVITRVISKFNDEKSEK